jgi:hypothetical protein
MLTKLITSEIAFAAEIEGHKVLVIYIFCESYSASSPLLRYINQEIVNSIPGLIIRWWVLPYQEILNIFVNL